MVLLGKSPLFSNPAWSSPADPLAAPAITAIPFQVGGPLIFPFAAMTAAASGLADPVGTAGDKALRADVARVAYGVSGAGVKVGILSDSFNIHGGYALDIADGALPVGVQVLQEGPSSGGDEGRAMAELVHQVAPGASLAFATAFRSEADFASQIKALATVGCNIIVDDVTYLDEPFFQDGGAIQRAVASVVASGVSYFTSASNEGTNFYEHTFTGVAAKLPGLNGNYQAMNFGTAAGQQTLQSLTIAKGATATIDLQWDQPFASIGTGHASANSLGLVLYDATGKIVASALTNRTGGDPVQILRFTNSTAGTGFRLGIITNGGAVPPNLFKYIVYGQGTTINDANAGVGSGTIIGHEDITGANSVGAVAAGSGKIEGFSSVGPGMILFDGSGNRLSTAVTGSKVDFVAPDGIATSVFSPFYGTSAAAPDTAAVAALMLQANPKLTPGQVTTMLGASAVTVSGAAGGVGAGLVQANTAVALALAAKSAVAAPVMLVSAIDPVTAPGSLLPRANFVSSAVAAVAQDASAQADFFVQIMPGTPMADIQATSSTAFALSHNLFGVVVPVLADSGANPLA